MPRRAARPSRCGSAWPSVRHARARRCAAPSAARVSGPSSASARSTTATARSASPGVHALLAQPPRAAGLLPRRREAEQPRVVLARDEVQRPAHQPADDERAVVGQRRRRRPPPSAPAVRARSASRAARASCACTASSARTRAAGVGAVGGAAAAPPPVARAARRPSRRDDHTRAAAAPGAGGRRGARPGGSRTGRCRPRRRSVTSSVWRRERRAVMDRWWPRRPMSANDHFVCQPYTSRMADAAVFDATRLNVFREVVRRGSLSAAAQALNFTQPAVSRQIAALEREAGAQLLERTPRGIRLTERRTGAARARGGDPRPHVRGPRAARVRRADGRRAAAHRRLPDRHRDDRPAGDRRVRRRAPGVELSLVEAVSPAAVAALRAGAVDLAIVTYLPELVGPDVEVVDLVDDELLVALPRRHPLARRRACACATCATRPGSRPAARHAAEPARRRRAGPRVRAARALRRRAVDCRSRASSPPGVGVTLIPGLAVATVRDDIVLRSLGPRAPPPPRRRPPPAGYRAPAVEPFVDVLRHESAAHAAALADACPPARRRRAGAAA